MHDCIFCRFVTRELSCVIVYEDAEILAFLDNRPIRPGHTQIIPKAHFETFDHLPPSLANRMMALGQRVSRRMKEVYRVERVGFLFTGGDVAHAHAHVIPLHDKTDITSARYIVNAGQVGWDSDHLLADGKQLEQTRIGLGRIVLSESSAPG